MNDQAVFTALSIVWMIMLYPYMRYDGHPAALIGWAAILGYIIFSIALTPEAT